MERLHQKIATQRGASPHRANSGAVPSMPGMRADDGSAGGATSSRSFGASSGGRGETGSLESATQSQLDAILAGLNPAQYKAVTHSGGHLLVIAGAGSGKTRVLTTRISFLIASGRVSAGEILAITFTNKAAKEMRERLEQMLGPVAHRMWISTFHSACVRILRAEHEALGMRSTFTIYDAADQQRLMKMVCAEDEIDAKQYTPKSLVHKVSDLKNEMVSVTQAEEQASNQDELVLAKAYRGYQTRLAAANAVDFDDLIMKTVQLLRSNELIAEQYRRRFRHILVDEYQDTNTAQYQLVKILAGDERDAVHGELTVVGDADQSIYAFRGATIRNIESFEDDFPNATTILLEQNYRSTQNILSAANALISNNRGRRAKNLWTDAGDGAKLVGYVADSELDEASFVVDEIDHLRAEQGYKYRDIAVFYRANAQSRALEEMLVRAGVPYKVVGGTKFYDRKEIKDAIAYLHAVINPDDTVSIRRVLNEPRRGLGAKAQDAVAQHARLWQISFGAALEEVAFPHEGHGEVQGLTPRARSAIQAFVTTLVGLRKRAAGGEALAEILDSVLDESGYTQMLQSSNDPQDETRLENLAELHSVASDYAVMNPEATVEDFLDHVSLVSDADQIPDEEGTEGEVVLMTIHTAKGLEFPVVFVTGLEDGTFPHIRSLGSQEELSEERRLAYVALTRARQRLYLTRAAARSQWGAPQELPPSRFLEEIPQDVIEWRRDESSIDALFGSASSSSRGFGTSGWGAGRSQWDDAQNRGSGRRAAWGKSRGGGSAYGSYDSDDDFAPPIGAGTFVPGKLGVAKKKTRNDAQIDASADAAAAHAASPSAPSRSGAPDTSGLNVGDRVVHKSFGKGKVLAFEGAGKSTVAEVKFDNGAKKRLMLRYAPLQKL